MHPHIIEALETEKRGLEVRLAALGNDAGPAGRRAMLVRRIGEIDAQLGVKPTRERRPATGAEKRPE